MPVWMVRAGRSGEREQYAIDHQVVVIGWDEVPDLSPCTSRESLRTLISETYPELSANRVAHTVGQLFTFVHRIQVGDLVIIPLKTVSALAIGRVVGPYQFLAEGPNGALHQRRVEWLSTDLPRSRMDQDLLYSLGAFMTVCQISRHNAEQRIRAVVNAPAPVGPATMTDEATTTEDEAPQDTDLNLEEIASDRISAFLQTRFCGHDLSRLINGILVAEGYATFLSPPGADGGVDILAGTGPLGFGAPRLAVQVKSGDSPVDVAILRALQGSMQTFRADQGLLVSWGGFKQTVQREAATHRFSLRLWDAKDIITNLLRVYDRLDEDLKAELPFKRIWTLAEDGDG